MKKDRRERRPEPPWDLYTHFPGLYPKGSEGDQLIVKLKEDQKGNEATGRLLTPPGDLISHHIISVYAAAPWNIALPEKAFNSAFSTMCDQYTLTKIDYRLRFCRAILSASYAIWWDDECEPYWEIENLPEGNVLDALGEREVNFRISTPEFYALKIIKHFRRFEELMYSGGDVSKEIGIWRELIFFGETWVEARFTVNHAKHIITGRKQHKVLSEHRNTAHRNSRNAADARCEAIRAMLHDTNRTGGALVEYLEKRLDREHGIPASARTIRRDLKKIRGN